MSGDLGGVDRPIGNGYGRSPAPDPKWHNFARIRESSPPEKWFLLNKIFNVMLKEISEMPGTPCMETARRRIAEFSRKYQEKCF